MRTNILRTAGLALLLLAGIALKGQTLISINNQSSCNLYFEVWDNLGNPIYSVTLSAGSANIPTCIPGNPASVWVREAGPCTGFHVPLFATDIKCHPGECVGSCSCQLGLTNGVDTNYIPATGPMSCPSNPNQFTVYVD